ncbi:hypothetical protein L1281_001402 [Neisseria sp. HSC-16F19]|nr:transferrin-binding protein-like solute binding protein [Neisseria sp. HSC-16F19]MCP2040812.1 hypothetical protein [Neisseria sp. HSC-16F19]
MTYDYKPLAVALAASFALSACGSSGGGGGGPDISSAQSPGTAVYEATTLGGSTIYHADTGTVERNGFHTAPGQHGSGLDTLKIDGITIPLFSDSTQAVEGYTLTRAVQPTREIYQIVSAQPDLSYTRFGFSGYGGYELDDNNNLLNQAQILNMFATGRLTTDMPTTGTATYSGYTLYAGAGGADHIDGFTAGSARFAVDYGNQTLLGVLTVPLAAGGDKSIALSGNITGNRFAGNEGGTQMHGAFYGPQAAELGGVYRNTTDGFWGSFGAKKD